MSGVISSSDVFAQQKLGVEKCTRMYTFQHACGCFLLAPRICSAYLQKRWFSTAMDGGDSTQKRDLRNANLAVKKYTWTYIF